MADSKKEQDQRADVGAFPDAWDRFERAVDVVAKSKPRPKRKDGDKTASGKGKAEAAEKKQPR